MGIWEYIWECQQCQIQTDNKQAAQYCENVFKTDVFHLAELPDL